MFLEFVVVGDGGTSGSGFDEAVVAGGRIVLLRATLHTTDGPAVDKNSVTKKRLKLLRKVPKTG